VHQALERLAILLAMAQRRIDPEIDRLYQLPLAEFTGARNALAKTAGADAADVRALQKPPVAAWAVNQLYWRNRDVYDALIAAATAQRQAHAAVLAGKQTDLRATGRTHDKAVETALKSVLDLLRDEGHPATDATRQAILTTLRALPASDPPGRLSRTLQPGGFEALTGISITGKTPPAPVKPAATKSSTAPASVARKKVDPQARARAKAHVATAARALRAAEHTARREEFEAARAQRDAQQAARTLESAREALRDAERAVADAEKAAADAEKKRDAADARSQEADAALRVAREKAAAAEAALEALS
jgi:hypothetical protein